jgi:undecaprenyl-diphosphatase
MNDASTAAIFARLDRVESALCIRMNRACRKAGLRKLFRVVSRLGDGVFWYSLVLALPFIYGLAALPASLHMSAVAIAGLLVYKLLKTTLVRHRPYLVHKDIELAGAPLDRGSFPSGHTLHAFAFSIVALSYYPELAWLLLPFTALVALSRVVLGLHYPSDVLAGATLGTLLATLSLLF